ncbi:hypothetical protein [Aliivibrio fischeri]|uniref:hypothetical protein n=1 Tax=Aliivibrio fischeri TaxID=668 RepID=UPI0012DA8B7E|nr:hypothetical protein [Aliivibrio fischeri]MUL11669.1 hypothetical protein [Aliivibrio fischeri]MUL15502.1 hypothetical protein [Aliivibrio fischeri]
MKLGQIDIGELKAIPGIELGDEKEVFAFYGLASFNAQCAEKALVNFAMAYKLLDESILSQEHWLDIYNNLNSNTFGRLLGQVKQRVDLPDELIEHLNESLAKRNWLAHDFFYDYAVHLRDEHGRIEMINELQNLITLFQIADKAVENLSEKVWSSFGITNEWLQKEMEVQYEEYLAERNA